MTVKTCVVYHSGYGHTARQAEAVLEGMKDVADVEASLIPVEDLEDEVAGMEGNPDRQMIIPKRKRGLPIVFTSRSSGSKGGLHFSAVAASSYFVHGTQYLRKDIAMKTNLRHSQELL